MPKAEDYPRRWWAIRNICNLSIGRVKQIRDMERALLNARSRLMWHSDTQARDLCDEIDGVLARGIPAPRDQYID